MIIVVIVWILNPPCFSFLIKQENQVIKTGDTKHHVLMPQANFLQVEASELVDGFLIITYYRNNKFLVVVTLSLIFFTNCVLVSVLAHQQAEAAIDGVDGIIAVAAVVGNHTFLND